MLKRRKHDLVCIGEAYQNHDVLLFQYSCVEAVEGKWQKSFLDMLNIMWNVASCRNQLFPFYIINKKAYMSKREE